MAFSCKCLGLLEHLTGFGRAKSLPEWRTRPPLTRASAISPNPTNSNSILSNIIFIIEHGQVITVLTWRDMPSYYGQICVKAQALTQVAKGARGDSYFKVLLALALKTKGRTDDERVAIASRCSCRTLASLGRWPTQYA